MKKSVFIFIFVFILGLTLLISPQITSQPNVPGTSDVNPETGLPKELEKLREIGDNLSEEEQRKEYLKQEWTKLLADNKYLAPILFYTNNVFSFFNPLWNIIFRVEFSWSWFFILSFLIWISIIILIYTPLKSFLDVNIFLNLIASIIVASLAGISGAINHLVNLLTVLITNIWILSGCILLGALGVFIYHKFISDYGEELREKTEKEKTERARKVTQAYGETIENSMEKE